jgi:outer membrane immunogenic protein
MTMIALRTTFIKTTVVNTIAIGTVMLTALGVAGATDLNAPVRPAPVYKAPRAPVSPVGNWSGFYAGIHGGYAWGGGDATTTVDPARAPLPPDPGLDTGNAAFASPFTLSTRPRGGIGGLQAGYNWQVDSIVLGVEADVSFVAGKQTESGTFTNRFPSETSFKTVGAVSLETKLEELGTLRGRAGFATDRVLVYATGGAAWGIVKNTVTSSGNHFQLPGGNDDNPNLIGSYGGSVSSSETRFGYAVGGGLDIALSDHWIVRGEYLFIDLRHGGALDVTAVPPVTSISTGLDLHVARAALNYRF